MKNRKRLVAAATAGAFLVAGAATATVSDSAFRAVEPVVLSDIEVVATQADSTSGSTPVTIESDVSGSGLTSNSVPSSGNSAAAESPTGVVPGMEVLQGRLDLYGDDFYLGGRELDFGPDRWMIATIAPADLDGDGTRGTWWEETNGLIGRIIVVLGDVDDDDVDVFQVNGTALRPLDRPAPWSNDWDSDDNDEQDRIPATTAITIERAKSIALEQVPGTVIGVDLDIDDRIVYWDIEVRSIDGDMYDIKIDAGSGRVIDVDRD